MSGGFLSFLLRPLPAEAGFFSSILGSEPVYAETPKVELGSSINSQTIALLQANVLGAPTLKPKDEKSNDDSKIDESASVNIISDNALLPATGPLGVADITAVEEFIEDETSVYVVRKGDTVSQIAQMFGVSPDTVMSVNDLKPGQKPAEGDVLIILPISGVEHTVTKGQTIQGIANLYKVEIDSILFVNQIEENAKIALGQKLIIPGAEMQSEEKPKSKTTLAANKSIGKTVSRSSIISSISGFFKNPVPGSIRTRGVKPGHQGVDLAAPTGTPIYAAASGKVLTAKTGWSGGFGNMAIIQHSNGTKTLYAHMSALTTSTGEQVSQGQVIGYVGNTGRSRGPHLHIEVLGGKNPF